MTGFHSHVSAEPTWKSKTLEPRTIQTTCIQMTTHTLEWTMQNYWHINKSPNLRQSLDYNLERTLQMPGTSLHIQSIFTTLTVYIFAISVSASLRSRSNSNVTLKSVHFSILLEMRSIVMSKTVLQFSKLMVTRIQFTVKIWPFYQNSFLITKIYTKIWVFSCSMCFARFKITSTILLDTSQK